MVAALTHDELVVVAEDGVLVGGVGHQLAAIIGEQSVSGSGPRVVSLGIPSKFIPHGKPDAILAQLGLDADGLFNSTLEQIKLLGL